MRAWQARSGYLADPKSREDPNFDTTRGYGTLRSLRFEIMTESLDGRLTIVRDPMTKLPAVFLEESPPSSITGEDFGRKLKRGSFLLAHIDSPSRTSDSPEEVLVHKFWSRIAVGNILPPAPSCALMSIRNIFLIIILSLEGRFISCQSSGVNSSGRSVCRIDTLERWKTRRRSYLSFLKV